MKHNKLAILLLATLLLAATYNEQDTFTFNGYEYNITNVLEDRILINTPHGRFILQANDCEVFDTHLWCVDNLTYDPVEYWPHEYEINISREKVCTDCANYGEACEDTLDCANYCVHEICRPTRTWCGDGVCDAREVCAEDCEEPEEITINVTEEPVNETNTLDETNTTEINNTVQEQASQEETPPQIVQPITSDETNWLTVGLIIFGGLFFIIMIFGRKKKTKDVYSYRK